MECRVVWDGGATPLSEGVSLNRIGWENNGNVQQKQRILTRFRSMKQRVNEITGSEEVRGFWGTK